MVKPEDKPTQPAEDEEDSEESEPQLLPLGRKRPLDEPKGRAAGQAVPATTWANMQPVPISEQFRRIAENKKKETGKKWGPTKIGRLAGYADHGQASEILRGSNDDHGLVRIANALGCELMAVPAGSLDSVLARLHQANQRELAALIGLLDVMLEFRDEPDLMEHFEGEPSYLRKKIGRFRGPRPPSAS